MLLNFRTRPKYCVVKFTWWVRTARIMRKTSIVRCWRAAPPPTPPAPLPPIVATQQLEWPFTVLTTTKFKPLCCERLYILYILHIKETFILRIFLALLNVLFDLSLSVTSLFYKTKPSLGLRIAYEKYATLESYPYVS